MRVSTTNGYYDGNEIYMIYENGGVKMIQGNGIIIITEEYVNDIREALSGVDSIILGDYTVIVDHYEVVIQNVYCDITIFDIENFISAYDAVFEDEDIEIEYSSYLQVSEDR